MPTVARRSQRNGADQVRDFAVVTSAARIAAGYAHTLCVKAGGRVYAWGNNFYGQLGVEDKEKRVVPT